MKKTFLLIITVFCACFIVNAQPPSSPFNKTKGEKPAAPPPKGQTTSALATQGAGSSQTGSPTNSQPQPKKAAVGVYEKEFQERVKKSEINGVYIPKDLFDALDQLDKLISDESKAKFKTHSEEESVHKLYFSLGRWIWTNWSLLEGSRLSEFFREYGIHHPEDISIIIIRSYHRRLNGKDLGFKQQMDDLKAKYAKEDADKKAKSMEKAEKEDGKNYLTKEEVEAKKKGKP